MLALAFFVISVLSYLLYTKEGKKIVVTERQKELLGLSDENSIITEEGG
jgi:preprotein translocase subunit SecG